MMLQSLLSFLEKKVWIAVSVAIVAISMILLISAKYPLQFKIVQCKVTENTYALHETTYRLTTAKVTNGGAIVRLCIKELIKTHQDNLVAIPRQ